MSLELDWGGNPVPLKVMDLTLRDGTPADENFAIFSNSYLLTWCWDANGLKLDIFTDM